MSGSKSVAAKPAGRSTGRRPHAETVELHIPSQLGWERAAMDLAAGVARRMGFPDERVEDIKTAVSEATTNAIEHGNAHDAARSVVVMLVPEEEKLEIQVQDQSPTPFGPISASDLAPNLDD